MTDGTWKDFLDSGDLQKYEKHFNAMDAKIAEEEPCENCEGPMQYAGYARPTEYGRSYRAFAICKTCDQFIEF